MLSWPEICRQVGWVPAGRKRNRVFFGAFATLYAGVNVVKCINLILSRLHVDGSS